MKKLRAVLEDTSKFNRYTRQTFYVNQTMVKRAANLLL